MKCSCGAKLIYDVDHDGKRPRVIKRCLKCENAKVLPVCAEARGGVNGCAFSGGPYRPLFAP